MDHQSTRVTSARHLRRPMGEKGSWSRRRFLQVSSAGVAAGGLLPTAVQARGRRRARRKSTRDRRGTLDPTLLKIVNRITMGFTRATYDEAAALGYEGFLESQLDYESIDDSEWEARLPQYGFPSLDMTSQEIFETYGQNNQNVPTLELMQAAVLRGIYSKRQLLERMVAFWTDHFNIEIQKGFCRFLKTADDRDVIRQHAMTTFPQILSASARSPAMLFYLDNWTNTVGHAQENYAREVMELHSLGVDGGYGQGTVEEVARCFTGWSINFRDSGPWGEFVFRENEHDFGEKRVVVSGVEHTIPAGRGIADGEDVLDILSMHPSTARFISKKLCIWFLGYDPPEDIVEAVKEIYLTTGGNIKDMLRVILHPNVLAYLSTPKLKRPIHLLTSLLRATDADVRPQIFRPYIGSLLNPLERMGQVPFVWPTPDGYPDTAEAWGTSILPRWQFGFDALYSDEEIPIDVNGLLESEGGNFPGEQAEAINRILTGGVSSAEETELIQGFHDSAPAQVAARDAFTLGASVPSFQWY